MVAQVGKGLVMSTHERRTRLLETLRDVYGRAAGAREEVSADLQKPSLFRLWPALVIGLALLATLAWGLFLAHLALAGMVWLWTLLVG